MSRQLSRSSAAQAALAAVLVVAVVLLLVVSGRDDTEGSAGRAEGVSAQAEAPRELAGGFTTIPEDRFFATIASAQERSGGWHQAVALVEDDQAVAVLSQDVWMDGDQRVTRGTLPGANGQLTVVHTGGALYLRGNDRQEKPWWKVPDRPAFQALRDLADQEPFLESFSNPRAFEVVGVEEIDTTAPDGRDTTISAVHYTIEFATPADDGQAGTSTETTTMNFWLDDQDRPVQAVTTSSLDGVETEATLLYSRYGRVAPIEAPPADQVTTKVPADYRAGG
ncbi:hypothetical protein ncot_16790 [Nocardioides sp. JQ2195]|uniref:hypothetical protein n=1 Tax=Nocardioides sp. JQ2195 TaxID=2592334 RepID=UPI00143E880F|nr:hypothetical protein [Nocardioides sp. JQ2195]QIX28065.1 hypothetical protein ncot_16790 [Nocardioides sp. JQ2195]